MSRFSPVAQAPRYLQSFQCQGSACLETCCSGWQVTIDKPSFQKYQAIKIQPLADLVRQHVRKQSGPGVSTASYAVIALGTEQQCPMLDAQSLCQIHRDLGAQSLSSTCKEYPRVYTQEGAQLGLSSSLSCPEAARLALDSAEAMDWVDMPLPFANANLVPLNRRVAAVEAEQADPVRRHARRLREALVEIIRYPGLSASQALVLGGLLLRRVASLELGDSLREDDELAEALAHYLAPAHLSRAAELVRGLQVPKSAQAVLLMGATQQFLTQYGGRPSFRSLIEDVNVGLRAQATGQPQAIGAARFAAWDAAHPYGLKNYLLNSLSASLFPRHGLAGLEEDYMGLVVHFALIKFYLECLAARPAAVFSQEDLLRVVYVVSRNIEHNQHFMPLVLQSLREQGALGLEVLATLVA